MRSCERGGTEEGSAACSFPACVAAHESARLFPFLLRDRAERKDALGKLKTVLTREGLGLPIPNLQYNARQGRVYTAQFRVETCKLLGETEAHGAQEFDGFRQWFDRCVPAGYSSKTKHSPYEACSAVFSCK